MTRLFATSLAASIALIAPTGLAWTDPTGPLRINGPLSVESETEHFSPADFLSDEAASEDAPADATAPDATETGEPVAEQPVDDLIPAAQSAEGNIETPGIPSEPLPTETEEIEETEVAATASSGALPATEKLPLGQSASPLGESRGSAAGQSRMGSIVRTVGATAAVICLILLLRFAFVKLSGTTGGLRAQLGAAGKAPSGVLFVLGRYPVSRGMSLVLLQLDQRVILLSQTGAGFHTLAELTDADEVASIIRKVKDESGESISAKFTGMLKKFESDPATLEDLDPAASARPVRLRQTGDAYSQPFAQSQRTAGYYEPKPERSVSTGEDELRSRINRLREYGA